MGDRHILERTNLRFPEFFIPPKAKCLEIGVWKGTFSDRILTHDPSELYLVDPWVYDPEFEGTLYGGAASNCQDDMDQVYQFVLDKYKNRDNVFVYREKSQDAGELFEDEYFDWIYVDGNHFYPYVLQDLEIYSKKLKRGGFLCGDDWGEGNDVDRSLKEFKEKYGHDYIDKGLQGGNFVLQKGKEFIDDEVNTQTFTSMKIKPAKLRTR